MKRFDLAGLVALNCVLLIVLGVLSFAPQPTAEAQIGGAGQNYIMVGGQIPGRVNNTVYITDLSSGRMIAVSYNQNRGELEVGAGRDLTGDFRGRNRR